MGCCESKNNVKSKPEGPKPDTETFNRLIEYFNNRDSDIYEENPQSKKKYVGNPGKSVTKKTSGTNENYYNHDNYSSHEEDFSRKNSNRSASMRDECNRELGSVDRYGVVRDDCNREIAKFESDGVVRDDCNREIGKIDSDGVVRDDCNREKGRVDSDGVVRDDCNREIGRIDDDGVVRDDCNREIGRAEGMSKEQAAYMYFFK